VSLIYEGESVNRSQMNIKSTTCDIRTLEKHVFLDIHALVPSLYQCVETPHHRSLLTLVSATYAPCRASSATFERP
jgi:hypothetical protein